MGHFQILDSFIQLLLIGVRTMLQFSNLLVVFAIMESNVIVAKYEEEKQLRHVLFYNHSSDILPLSASYDKIGLNVSAEIMGISLHESGISAAVTLGVSWTDYNLGWRPADHGFIDSIYPKPTDIWIPHFDVIDSIKQGFHCAITRIRLRSDGVVNFACHGQIEISCQSSFVKYPFDDHECDLAIYPENVHSKEVYFMDSSLSTKERNGIGEWQVQSKVGTGDRVLAMDYIISTLTITINVKRDFVYVVMFSMVPLVLLSLLNLVTFWLPDKSMKIYFSVTILLVTTISLSRETSNKLPRTSNCAFNIYRCALFLLNVITIYVVITLWRREYKEEKDDEDDSDDSVHNSMYDFKNPHNGVYQGKISRRLKNGCIPWCSKTVEDVNVAEARVKQEAFKYARKTDYKIFLVFAVIWIFITGLFFVKIIGIV